MTGWPWGRIWTASLIESLIAMSNEPTFDGIADARPDAPPIMIRTRRKTIVPRTRHSSHLHAQPRTR